MTQRSRRAAVLLALNWVLFAAVYVWISGAQGNLLWWLRLDWGSWLSDFSAMARLGTISSGSFWILWLMTSLLMSAAYLFKPSQRSAPVAEEAAASSARKQLIPNAELIESRPDLKEKILRLHQSLEKI